jgi:hypothetical protein
MSFQFIRGGVRSCGLALVGLLTISATLASQCLAAGADTDVQSALDGAVALRVEFATDISLQIIDSGRASTKTAVQVLETLYHRADEALEKYPTLLAPRQAVPNKAEVFGSEITDQGLDSLNIRVRVLKRLAALDGRAARRLLSEFPRAALPSDTGCDQLAVPFAGKEYYKTLWQIFPEFREETISRVSTPQDVAGLLLAVSGDAGGSVENDLYSRLALVLGTARVSDRVFATTEWRLQLGDQLEAKITHGAVPAAFQIPLAKAYIEFVTRQLKSERCDDRPVTKGEDVLIAGITPAIQRLSARFNIPGIDLSGITSAVSTKEPKVPQSTAQAELTNLAALGMKLQNGGSPDVAAQFAVALQGYAQHGLEQGANAGVYDQTARASALILLMSKFTVDEVTSIAVPEFCRLLEDPKLRDMQPTAWAFLMRHALNLTLHPATALANRLRDRLEHSTDRDVSAYLTAQRSVGLIRKFDPDPLGMNVKCPY